MIPSSYLMMTSTVGTGFLYSLLAFKPDIYVLFRNYRRYGVLVNKLLADIFEKDDKIIETLYHALQPHPVCEINDNRHLVFPELVKIIVLKTLSFVVCHPLSPLSAYLFFIYHKLFSLKIQGLLEAT